MNPTKTWRSSDTLEEKAIPAALPTQSLLFILHRSYNFFK
jgi:hypothetical protein